MSRLVFIDTETTSLRPDRRAWEIGLIVRDGESDREHNYYVAADGLDLGNADPMSLRIGRFYERHPDFIGSTAPKAWVEHLALEEVERLTRGAHLVGAVPNFDADVLAARMRDNGVCPSWHYHLIDIEALAVGALAATGDLPPDFLPWRSDELSRALGVEPPSGEHRHTALGDARWARDVYDAVMTRAGGDG